MIYLVRHGETNWNKEGRIQGVQDTPLNMTGIKQAMDQRDLYRGHHFTHVFTSPLQRAKKTAEILTAKAKVDNFEVKDELIEYDFGKRDGLTFEEDAKLIDQVNSGEIPDDLGEEDQEKFIRRLSKVLIEAGLNKGNIMLVSHGAVISTLVRMLLPNDPNEYIMLKNNSVCCIDNEVDENGNLKLSLAAIDCPPEELEKFLSNND